MNKRKHLTWFIKSIIKALKTAAQAAIASMGTSAVMAQISWKVVLSTAGLAALLSFLMSLENLPDIK